jgi:hypothetical protein
MFRLARNRGNVRGAVSNSFFGAARVSPVGDAYELASAFGNDFSTLLVTGASLFGAKLPSLPLRIRARKFYGRCLSIHRPKKRP